MLLSPRLHPLEDIEWRVEAQIVDGVFQTDVAARDLDRNCGYSLFFFIFHALKDFESLFFISWCAPEAFMLLSSAFVEYSEAARATVGTAKSFAIKIGSDLSVGLSGPLFAAFS